MRLLYVITGAEFGGPCRHVLRLMEHLKKQGHQVGLVSAPGSRLWQQAQKLDVELFPNAHFLRPVPLYEDLLSLGPVLRAIRAFKPELLSAHSTKAGFAARLCAAISRATPVIFTAHGWSFTEGKNKRSRHVLALAERLAAGFTQKIICVSEYDRRMALRFKVAPEDKLVTIHNGVAHQPFLALSSAAHEECGAGATSVVTMVARLVPQKDPLTLLRACLLLSKGIPQASGRPCFKVLLVGDGVLRTQAADFLRKNPKLDGSVALMGEREDIPEILAASDIFVLCSQWEGLPRAIIEAMLAGLPVVATRVGGVPELVDHGVTGFAVPPRDPEALAAALRKLLDDPELCRRMGKAGQKKALQDFSLERMLYETQAVYEELLLKSPHSPLTKGGIR